MSALVIDTSVAAKWFFPEENTPAAVRLLNGRHRLLALDLIWAEFGNLVWKHHRKGLVDAAEAAELVAQFLRVPLEVHASGPLVGEALHLAIETGRTAYDCLYLALAIQEGCSLMTADARFVHALGTSALADRIRLLA